MQEVSEKGDVSIFATGRLIIGTGDNLIKDRERVGENAVNLVLTLLCVEVTAQ